MSLIGIVFLSLIIGISLSIPGLGLQTQTYINSLKKEVNKDIPKGKIEIPDNILSSQIIGTKSTVKDLLRYTYLDDCLSTLTPTQFADSNINKAYTNYANSSFEKNLNAILNSNSDNMVDMNEFSMKLFDFDLSITKQNGINQNTINNGFVRSGLSWYGHGSLKELLNSKSNVKQTAINFSKKTTPEIQIQYNNEIKLANYASTKTPSTLAANNNAINYILKNTPKITAVSSINSIVANKTWFFNEQLRTLLMLNYAVKNGEINWSSKNNEESKKITEETINNLGTVVKTADSPIENPIVTVTLTNPIVASDLKQPNYLSAFKLNQAGASLLFFIFPVILISSSAYLIYYSKNNNNNISNKKSIIKEN